MLAKNLTKIKFFIKDWIARIDPIGTHMFLLGIVGNYFFVVIFIGRVTQNREHSFLLTAKVRLKISTTFIAESQQ